MNYSEMRGKAKSFLLKTLEKNGLSQLNLRGSWLVNDFHLESQSNRSYSDVDLFISGLDETEKKRLTESIANDLTSYFSHSLPVSIHSGNSLYQINVSDAQVLGIAEYIAQYRKILATSSLSKDYIDAKFTLLLLRKSFDERYQDVSNRIGTIQAKRAFDVKLGRETSFPLKDAQSLIQEFGNSTASQFYDYCLKSSPNDYVASMTLSQLSQCKTIDQWLYGYLVNKVNQYGAA